MPPQASPSLELPSCAEPAPGIAEALDILESLVSELPSAAEGAVTERIAAAAVEAARLIAVCPRGQLTSALIERVTVVGAALRTARAFETWPMPEAGEICGSSRGAGAAAARMLLGPAWRSPSTPLLGEVPESLWGDYAAWLFTTPQIFTVAGDVDRFAVHFLRHAEELARWVERNLGSPAVRAALESYLARVAFLPLAVGSGSLKRQAEAHGRILTAAGGVRRTADRPARSRSNRKLRIAFVASHPAAIPACYRSLDSHCFEVSAYALEGVEEMQAGEGADVAVSAVLALLRSAGPQQCRQLPPALVQQMAELGELGPDVIVYAEDLALSGGRLAQLAAQRIAPLQVVVAPASVTTGLSTIDVFAMGETAATATAAQQFTERIAVLPGSGQLFSDLPDTDAVAGHARAALAIAPDACVLMTVARLVEITPARMTQWVEMLRQLPEAVLVIQLLQSADLPPGAINAVGAEWDRRLIAAGVAPERGLIFASPINSVADLQRLVVAADVFLDASAVAEPDLLHVPLALGVPVVTRDGETLRTQLGAAVLRSLGLTESIARDEAQWHEIIAALASDPARRQALGARARTALEHQPLCRDPLAAADALGAMLDRAHAEMLAVGARKFRAAAPLVMSVLAAKYPAEMLRLGAEALAADDLPAALRCAREILVSDPAHAGARALAGRAYLAGQEPGAAVNYLLAAVQSGDDAAVWFDLAVALHRHGQTKEALQALETSLRHDGTRADAWVMLIELAKAVGADDTARDALTALRECAPADPRLPELAAALVQAG